MATSDARPAGGGTCPRCFGTVEQTPTEHYCPNCGLVTDDAPLDRGPDWGMADDPDEDPRRAKPGDRNLPDRGLGSERAPGGDVDERRKTKRDHRARTGSKRDRNRAYATTEIQRMASALELPDTLRDRAKRLFRDLHSDSLEGWNLDTVSASCLYLACRERQIGLTAGDVAAVARTGEREIARRVLWVSDETGAQVPPPSVEARVRVVGRRLDARRERVESAIGRVDEAADGSSPSVLAANALYAVGHWTQREVADAADVTPNAMRKSRKRVSSTS